MNKVIMLILSAVTAATAFVWLSAKGQSDSPVIVDAQHQVPVVVSVEVPGGADGNIQFTILLDIESKTALSDMEVISTSVHINAEVLSEVFTASVVIGSALDSQATVIMPVSTTLSTTTLAPKTRATVKQTANLRSCPGMSCEILRLVEAGQEVEISGQSADGAWYQLVSGEWIATKLVDVQGDAVPVTETSRAATETPSLPQQPSGAKPRIEFTFVPAYGGYDNLQGQVRNVELEKYAVAVYIYQSGWWTKPTFDNPLTSITSSGLWTTDITTGGADHQATQIAAFLIPVGYDAPELAGTEALPQELYSNAVTYAIEERTGTAPTKEATVTGTKVPTPSNPSITLEAAGVEVRGKVGPTAVCNENYKVILYAKTNMWYVQPFDDSRRNIKINDDCTWHSPVHQWKELAALLVAADYHHPTEILELACPPLDSSIDPAIFATVCYP